MGERVCTVKFQGFALDADITVSELREEDILNERLGAFHYLRLRRRNEVLGVVVEAGVWRLLVARLSALEQQLERYEDQAVRAIIADRAPGAAFVQVTPEVVDDIERRYQALTGE